MFHTEPSGKVQPINIQKTFSSGFFIWNHNQMPSTFMKNVPWHYSHEMIFESAQCQVMLKTVILCETYFPYFFCTWTMYISAPLSFFQVFLSKMYQDTLETTIQKICVHSSQDSLVWVTLKCVLERSILEYPSCCARIWLKHTRFKLNVMFGDCSKKHIGDVFLCSRIKLGLQLQLELISLMDFKTFLNQLYHFLLVFNLTCCVIVVIVVCCLWPMLSLILCAAFLAIISVVKEIIISTWSSVVK